MEIQLSPEISECMKHPTGSSGSFSEAIKAACDLFGIVKSAEYHKSEEAITLEIQFEKNLIHDGKKKSIDERLRSFKAEWKLEPLPFSPQEGDKSKENNATAGAP